MLSLVPTLTPFGKGRSDVTSRVHEYSYVVLILKIATFSTRQWSQPLMLHCIQVIIYCTLHRLNRKRRRKERELPDCRGPEVQVQLCLVHTYWWTMYIGRCVRACMYSVYSNSMQLFCCFFSSFLLYLVHFVCSCCIEQPSSVVRHAGSVWWGDCSILDKFLLLFVGLGSEKVWAGYLQAVRNGL